MRIVIDMQGAQSSGSRNRGIGRYTSSLVEFLVSNREDHEIIIALSDLFPETIVSIRSQFSSLLPKSAIRVWTALSQVDHLNKGNVTNRRVAERVFETFLKGLNPDFVLVTSVFEGLSDDAVSYISPPDKRNFYVACILYDLIPLINASVYLENPDVSDWYYEKLSYLKNADLLLSISNSSRNEAIKHLGFDKDRVINISTAADSQFRPISLSIDHQNEILGKYGLNKPYVMYTGGIDHRKNIDGLIEAFAKLPSEVRSKHQLAVVCNIPLKSQKDELLKVAKKRGLSKKDIVLTGYVPEEELLALYNLCKVFVFPSIHEGFGLPALEAMMCGKAVIGSCTSSIPEVINNDDALFDPKESSDICSKLKQVLTDLKFRQTLEAHSRVQAKSFSWEKTAQNVIQTFESFLGKDQPETKELRHYNKLKLAFVSPLPPAKSGISDYSAELLPELSRYYDIDVIVVDGQVSDEWIIANCQIKTVDWLWEHATAYDRVLYHFGNSEFHTHMFHLLPQIPGVIVLHDFYLSGIIGHRETQLGEHGVLTRSIYYSHGYVGLYDRFFMSHQYEAEWKYPCNLEILQQAKKIISHSQLSKRLAVSFYGSGAEDKFSVVPLLRHPSQKTMSTRIDARSALGIDENKYVVCSFGHLGLTKKNHLLLEAWNQSKLAEDPTAMLIFVGECPPGGYGDELRRKINSSNSKSLVMITGWTDIEDYKAYLHAADVGVQLRTLSRGETSAAVLDCMNYGLATIVNANGAMVELPQKAVWMLPDEFTATELIEALETLRDSTELLQKLQLAAYQHVQDKHSPQQCAYDYFTIIEEAYLGDSITQLSRDIASIDAIETLQDDELVFLSESIALSLPRNPRAQQILVDVSELVEHDTKTGIQRVVKNVLHKWLLNPPSGYRVEPVYASLNGAYRYARKFTCSFLGIEDKSSHFDDEPISYASGDIFFALDFSPLVTIYHRNFLEKLSRIGVSVKFMVYDLLCMTMPEYFIDRAKQRFTAWLEMVASFDGAIAISKTVADELNHVLDIVSEQGKTSLSVEWFNLGVEQPVMTDIDLGDISKKIRSKPTFLMVGTIEPRKGYSQVIKAFEYLWQGGEDVNLCIVGQKGWLCDEIMNSLKQHTAKENTNLVWLNYVDDAILHHLYAKSTCLIAASFGEGYGLPLIEAAQHRLPIIARDIPVFNEVIGNHAFYFNSDEPKALANEIKNWLQLYQNGNYPRTDGMDFVTWQQSAEQLLNKLLLNKGLNVEANYSDTML